MEAWMCVHERGTVFRVKERKRWIDSCLVALINGWRCERWSRGLWVQTVIALWASLVWLCHDLWQLRLILLSISLPVCIVEQVHLTLNWFIRTTFSWRERKRPFEKLLIPHSVDYPDKLVINRIYLSSNLNGKRTMCWCDIDPLCLVCKDTILAVLSQRIKEVMDTFLAVLQGICAAQIADKAAKCRAST